MYLEDGEEGERFQMRSEKSVGDQIICDFISPIKEFSLCSKWIGKSLQSCQQRK